VPDLPWMLQRIGQWGSCRRSRPPGRCTAHPRKRGCIVVIDEDRCWPAHEASSVRATFQLRARLGLTSNQ
ncbi:MAG: hypothetical protein LC647_08955, partial [Beggiatoa sp.]|nr:hypothetical protein [Beggiatoa sp.]